MKLLSQALRYVLVDDPRSLDVLHQLQKHLSLSDWKEFEDMLKEQVAFYQRPWTRLQQVQFEDSLENGMEIRAFWTREQVPYTAKAKVSRVNWERTNVHLQLLEDVEEASLKEGDEIRLPLMKNVKFFHLKTMRIAPLFEKEKKDA